MLYCPKCQILTENKRCPFCRNRQLRAPEENDPVLLITACQTESGRIAAVLEENGIPFEQRVVGLETLPAAYFGQSASGDKNSFVPYGALEKSRELLRGIGILEEDDREGALSDFPPEDSAPPMGPVKRLVWRVVSILLFILLVWAVVTASDSLFGYLKGWIGL